MSDRSPYLLTPGTAERRWMNEVGTWFLATGERTGGAFALVDECSPQGESVPLHRHAADDESFYVVDGEVTFFVDGTSRRGGPGTFVHVPGGVVHGFRVESPSARYLILTTARHGEFYRAISLPETPGGGRPTQRVSGETIAHACEQYGIEFVGRLP